MASEMELVLLLTATGVVLLLSTTWVLLVYLKKSSSSSSSRQAAMPPDGGRWMPVVGETLSMISAYRTEEPETFIDERVESSGSKVFTSHVFGETTVFSADPDVNRQVLQSEGKVVEGSYPSSISTLLGKHSLVLAKGAHHRRMHSFTLSCFSNPSVLRDVLLPDIHKVVIAHFASLQKQEEQVSMMIMMMDVAKQMTFELAVKQLMGEQSREWTEGLRKEYLLLVDGFFSLPIPFFSFTTYGRALKARSKVALALSSIVRQRQRQRQSQQLIKSDNDVLGMLLAEGITDEEQVVDFLLSLLVAGYETTPTAMTIAARFLEHNPSVLAQLREEHDKIKKKDDDDDGSPYLFGWNDYKTAMPFTHCVINETLRMSNIISGVFRRTTADVPIKVKPNNSSYAIPKGCKLFASFRAVHMDHHYFQNARTFDPSRWLNPNDPHSSSNTGSKNTNNNPYFCAFGGGARLCPGYELARVELCVFLHHLVTSFIWEAAEDDCLLFFPTTRTLKGYPVRLRRRSIS